MGWDFLGTGNVQGLGMWPMGCTSLPQPQFYFLENLGGCIFLRKVSLHRKYGVCVWSFVFDQMFMWEAVRKLFQLSQHDLSFWYQCACVWVGGRVCVLSWVCVCVCARWVECMCQPNIVCCDSGLEKVCSRWWHWTDPGHSLCSLHQQGPHQKSTGQVINPSFMIPSSSSSLSFMVPRRQTVYY